MTEIGAMFFVGLVFGIMVGVALMWDRAPAGIDDPTEHQASPL